MDKFFIEKKFWVFFKPNKNLIVFSSSNFNSFYLLVLKKKFLLFIAKNINDLFLSY